MTSSNPHHELIRRAQTQVNRLRSRLAHASTTASSDAQTPGQSPPPAPDGYRILREIKRGGQGVVYPAEQESTCRTVALKIMREGPLASEAERVRFRREVRVLATLKHPHIVTIHDSGESGGRFYYIMDYIEGLPLDAYVRVNRPAGNDTLRLFVKVADAVNAAHLRGVIHRDLKPPNVLVDREGRPHVLDFGLAKVLSGDDDSVEGAALTRTGEFVGSLPWASPEQAEGRHDDVDLRTDVYALGLLLYQMLTGELPYRLSGTTRQILDTIVTKPPIRPRDLRPEIDPDIETIVLKCLAKERGRRYQTAGELGQDVSRCRNGLPIEARRDSMVYVLRKHAARHKLAVVLSSALLAALLGGSIGMFGLWLRAAGERDNARLARQAETDQREIADARAADAEAVTQFLTSLLSDADPSQHGGQALTVREALDDAAELVDQGQFDGRPRVEAAVRSTLGNTYEALGVPVVAVRHFRRSLELHKSQFGPKHVRTAAALYELGALQVELGRTDEAESLLQRAVECYRRAHAGAHEDTAVALNALARCHQIRRNLPEAERLYREALSMLRESYDEDAPVIASVENNLGLCLLNQKQFAEAERAFRSTMDTGKRLGISATVEQATVTGNLALALFYQSAYPEAEASFRASLDLLTSLLGERHILTANAQHNLGRCLRSLERYSQARSMFEAALDARRSHLPAGHPAVLATGTHLGAVLLELQMPKLAETTLTGVLAESAGDPVKIWPSRINARNILADALMEQERFEESVNELLANLRSVRESESLNPSYESAVLDRLVQLYDAWGKPELAKPYRQQLRTPTSAPADDR